MPHSVIVAHFSTNYEVVFEVPPPEQDGNIHVTVTDVINEQSRVIATTSLLWYKVVEVADPVIREMVLDIEARRFVDGTGQEIIDRLWEQVANDDRHPIRSV